MTPDWLYLLLAAAFEISWPVGLKMAQGTGRVLVGSGMAVLGMAASGFFLYLAQRTIPIGTAYAAWTGIGAAGTFLIGILAYGDPAAVGRILGVTLIVAGVAILKLTQ